MDTIYHRFPDLQLTFVTTERLLHDYRVGLLDRTELLDLSQAIAEPDPSWAPTS